MMRFMISKKWNQKSASLIFCIIVGLFSISDVIFAALVSEGVVERVGNNQITAAGKEPIQIPLHVRALKGVGIVLVTAHAKAFVAIAAFATVTGTVGGAFAHGAVTAADIGGIAGVVVSPNDIMTGDIEV